jgi:hypothetical protein
LFAFLPKQGHRWKSPKTFSARFFGTSSLKVTEELFYNTMKRETDKDVRKEPTKGLRTLKIYFDKQI